MVKNENSVKINRTFMRDEAYVILQDWIVSGKLPAGTQLRVQELSEMLGISRTPVREALLRLEDDGLVVTKANRWTLVSPINLKEAEDIYSIVEALEILAIEHGIKNISTEDIDELEELNENFKTKLQNGDTVAAFQADYEFHDKIVRLSNNVELSKLLINLKIKIQRLEIHYFSESNNSFESYKEHIEIINSLKEKNISNAVDSIKANWKNSLNRIQQNNND